MRRCRWLWADRSQVTQILQNLIGNAIKFRGKEAPAISVQAEKTGEQWLFSVSDNGIGIAPETGEHIFVVFQRLHTRAEYPGNGIGLAICKKIVEHCGGKIWVEAQADHGSIFKFTMPCDGPAEKELGGAEARTSSPSYPFRHLLLDLFKQPGLGINFHHPSFTNLYPKYSQGRRVACVLQDRNGGL